MGIFSEESHQWKDNRSDGMDVTLKSFSPVLCFSISLRRNIRNTWSVSGKQLKNFKIINTKNIMQCYFLLPFCILLLNSIYVV